MAGPLAGVRVLENASFISGPFAGMLLGDLGADVLKVEMPGSGDPFRSWGGSDAATMSSQFAAFNRAKQSLTVNLRSPEGREVYLRVAASCDVVLENFRPGKLDELGVGYRQVRERNEAVVYCSLSGMGSTGPDRDKPTYDAIAQAMSGLWSQLTDLGDPHPVGPALSDQVSGLYAANGILGALAGRAVSGRGDYLEVSMLAASLAFLAHPIAQFTMQGELNSPMSRPHRSQTYAFVGSDGKPLAIHLSSPEKFWRSLVAMLGREDLLADPRFAAARGRIANYDELAACLGAEFAKRPRAEWLKALDEHDIPAAPIYRVDEALQDPQVREVGVVRDFGTGGRTVRLAGGAVRFAAAGDAGVALPPPLLGEHCDSVLADAGYSAEQVTALRASGAI